MIAEARFMREDLEAEMHLIIAELASCDLRQHVDVSLLEPIYVREMTIWYVIAEEIQDERND
jgi:hypothetical protein